MGDYPPTTYPAAKGFDYCQALLLVFDGCLGSRGSRLVGLPGTKWGVHRISSASQMAQGVSEEEPLNRNLKPLL